MQELKAWFNKTSSDRSWDYRTTVLRANGTHQSPGPGPTDVSSVISQADLSLTFIFRSDCTLQQSPMKSGSRTASGHGLPQGGRHLKSNRTYKKIKDNKKIYLPLIYIIQSAILNPHPFIFKRKIYKNCEHKAVSYSE